MSFDGDIVEGFSPARKPETGRAARLPFLRIIG